MESQNENPGSWLAHHWVTVLMVFVGGIIIIGFLKVLSQLFNSQGPLAKGVADVLGAGVNILNGITSGCWTKQDKCDATTQGDCSKQTGCSWTPPAVSGAGGVCVNTTGLKPQEGSFASPNCFFGMASIFALCGIFIIYVIGPLIIYFTSKSNANIDIASRTTDTPVSTIREEVAKKALKTADQANKLKEEKTQKKSTEIEMTTIGKESAHVEVLNRALDSINGQSGVNAETKSRELQQSMDTYAKAREDFQTEARDAGVSEENLKEIDDAIDKVSEHPVEILDIISNNVKYNIHPGPQSLKYYIDVIRRKNLQLQLKDHHINYLARHQVI